MSNPSPVRSYMASVPLNIKPVPVVHGIQDEWGWLVACNWQVFSFNPSTNTSLLFWSLSNIFWNIQFEVVIHYTEHTDNVLMVNSFATFWAVSLLWRNWILWQAARALEALLARAETKAVEGGAIHVIHSGKPKKEDQTRSPNSNDLLIFPKRPEKQVLGCCIHYESARFMAMRMKMLVFSHRDAVRRSQRRNARNHTRFATPTPMLIQNSLGASLTRTRCKHAWHGLVDMHIFLLIGQSVTGIALPWCY